MRNLKSKKSKVSKRVKEDLEFYENNRETVVICKYCGHPVSPLDKECPTCKEIAFYEDVG